MNKRGQAFVFFMLAIVFILLGINLAYPMVQTVGESMLQLNCTSNYLVNDTLINQDRAYCTGLDVFSFLFTGICFSLAGLLFYGAFKG